MIPIQQEPGVGETYVDVECAQQKKHGEDAFGDCFLCRRLPGEDRVIAVLSDGMGSGIKASVLSTLTAHMALRFIASDSDILSSVQIMMDALPVCRTRGISYATFTVIDYRASEGIVRAIELDNPALVRMRGADFEPFARRKIRSGEGGVREVLVSEFPVEAGDRLVFMSDGVVQAGMGSVRFPMGWGQRGVEDFITDTLARHPGISALTLSGSVVSASIGREENQHAHDDISCAVMHFRIPRKAIVMTGPPAREGGDADYARLILDFPGKRIVCGGTTGQIVAREAGAEIVSDYSSASDGVPPSGSLAGVDLVTEGIITLNRAAELLEQKAELNNQNNPAARLVRLLRESDFIQFAVGTRENEGYLDSGIAGSIALRRNVITRIAHALQELYVKSVRIDYF